MSGSESSKVLKAKIAAAQFHNQIRALAKSHATCIEAIPEQDINPDECMWWHLGEKVFTEEGEMPHAALGAVVASLSVYVTSIDGAGTKEFDEALDSLVDAVDELRNEQSNCTPRVRILH